MMTPIPTQPFIYPSKQINMHNPLQRMTEQESVPIRLYNGMWRCVMSNYRRCICVQIDTYVARGCNRVSCIRGKHTCRWRRPPETPKRTFVKSINEDEEQLGAPCKWCLPEVIVFLNPLTPFPEAPPLISYLGLFFVSSHLPFLLRHHLYVIPLKSNSECRVVETSQGGRNRRVFTLVWTPERRKTSTPSQQD